MNPTVVLLILVALVCVLLGREAGKYLFGVNEKLVEKKRAAQALAIRLRAAGLTLLPKLLEDFVVGDVSDLLTKIHDLAKLVEAGNDAIEKDLEATYENVLDTKLATPEGMALIKAKIAVIEKASAPPPAAPLAPAAPPPAAPVQ
ncbi:MAG: hypothetical protein ABR915_21680 [Thermoguttaceae bacterium]|jgi:hypothetical protein